jgi:hypothetical protein
MGRTPRSASPSIAIGDKITYDTPTFSTAFEMRDNLVVRGPVNDLPKK